MSAYMRNADNKNNNSKEFSLFLSIKCALHPIFLFRLCISLLKDLFQHILQVDAGSEAFMAAEVDEIFFAYQLCQLVKNYQHFRDHL
jgi:hypothetical protein